jgi:hypothetical protein
MIPLPFNARIDFSGHKGYTEVLARQELRVLAHLSLSRLPYPLHK